MGNSILCLSGMYKILLALIVLCQLAQYAQPSYELLGGDLGLQKYDIAELLPKTHMQMLKHRNHLRHLRKIRKAHKARKLAKALKARKLKKARALRQKRLAAER